MLSEDHVTYFQCGTSPNRYRIVLKLTDLALQSYFVCNNSSQPINLDFPLFFDLHLEATHAKHTHAKHTRAKNFT